MHVPAVSCVLLPFKHVEQAVATAGNFAIANMHAHSVRGGEGAAHISLWFGNDNVHLWCKHTTQSYSHTEAHWEGCSYDLVVAAKVDWHKRQPDDTCGIHGEGNVFGFVEVCRDIASFEGVIGAAHDKQAIVAQWGYNTKIAGVADQKDFSDAGVGFNGFRRLHDDEGNLQGELDTDQNKGDNHLSPSTHESWFSGTYLLLAACQNAGNTVSFGYQGWVAHGCWESNKKPLKVAGGHSGTGDEGERTQIAQEDPCKDDVAELPAGGFDHRCVTVQDKDEGYKGRDQDAQAGKDHLDNGLWIAPLQVAQRDWLTAWKGKKHENKYSATTNWKHVIKILSFQLQLSG